MDTPFALDPYTQNPYTQDPVFYSEPGLFDDCTVFITLPTFDSVDVDAETPAPFELLPDEESCSSKEEPPVVPPVEHSSPQTPSDPVGSVLIVPTVQNIRFHEPREFVSGENQGKPHRVERDTVNWPRDETETRPNPLMQPVSLDTALLGTDPVLVHVRGKAMRFVSNRASFGSPKHPTTGLTRLLDEFYAFFTWNPLGHFGSTTVIIPDTDGFFSSRTYGYADLGAIMVTAVHSVRTSSGGVFETVLPVTVVLGPAVSNHADSLLPGAYSYMVENMHTQLSGDHEVHKMTEFMRKQSLSGKDGINTYRSAAKKVATLLERSALWCNPTSTQLSRVIRRK